MPEVLDEEDSGQLDLRGVVGIFRRRHLQFLLPLFLGWLIVWGVSWILPPTYKSTTTILVEQPTMPQNYVAPNISDDVQARIESMKTELLSQTRLLTIVHRLQLYGGAKDPLTEDARVNKMRKDIDVELVRDTQKQDVTAFQISYSASDPHVAQLVTRELTDLFINENNKVRQQESEGTTSFLEQQLEEARQSLAEQDAKVQQFESQHTGALPNQQGSNLQILAGLQQRLQNEQDALNTAKQQRVYFQAMLEEERANPVRVKVADANTAATGGATDLATVDLQLDKMRADLADLNSRYTDNYPDVVSLKRQIAKTEAVRNALASAAKQKSAGSSALGAVDPTLSEAGRQIESQLQANDLEIKNRENAISALNAQIGGYEGRLNLEPATEEQLTDLTRGYEQSKKNYDDLLQKKNESEMATSMEQMQQGERFTMLDPPSLPAKPDFPNRLKFCAMGIGVGFALGIAVVGGFEFMDDRLYSERKIKALLPMAVISEVPEVVSAVDTEKSKRKAAIGWATAGIVFVVILAGSAFSYLRS
jgi:succinoglycan biosynthesis transport protein ExoP